MKWKETTWFKQHADITSCKAGNKYTTRHLPMAYQYFVIVLPGVVNNFP